MLYRRKVKRLIDLTGSVLGVVVLSPVIAAIGVAIRCNSEGPALFTQVRVGLAGQHFKIYKFRTMLRFEDSLLQDGTSIPERARVTTIGSLLRRTSLDELPQLINVIRGEMSLVGPRPTLPYQVERYTEHQKRRLEVRPGMTGLAQVNGRNRLTWTEKIELDIEYADSISFVGDLKILLGTFGAVRSTELIYFTAPDDLSAHDADPLRDVGYQSPAT